MLTINILKKKIKVKKTFIKKWQHLISLCVPFMYAVGMEDVTDGVKNF